MSFHFSNSGVDFAPSTFVGNEALRECYEWGVIDFKTFGQYCLSNLGLPADVQVTKPPKDNPLGVGLPDPNADHELKEKEIGLKKEDLKFREREAKAAAKREEKAAKEEKTQQSKAEDDKKKKAVKRKSGGGDTGSAAKKAKNGEKGQSINI